MNNLSPLINILNKSIRITGKRIIRDFGEIEKLQSSIKKTETYAEITRKNLEKDIHEILRNIKPNLNISSFQDSNDENIWITDLADSQKNFSRGFDNFFINISLKEDNEIKTCVIYNPIKDEIFNFQSGLGGYKNDFRIRVSERRKLNESIISFYCCANHVVESCILGEIRQLIKKVNIETRESGSIFSDLCDIASGKIECVFLPITNVDLKNNLTLILSETGGIINELILQDQKIYIVSNKYIGKIIKEMIENKYEN